MSKPLMAKATAVWLVDNTTLSFAQIADFCGMHELEVQGIADGDVATGVKGFDPVANNQLDAIEITRAQADLPEHVPFDEILAVQRFDHLPDGSRIHMEEFNQALGYAAESMRLTTRLMQVASWLLVQRAVREGEMPPEAACAEAYRLGEEAPGDAPSSAEMVFC